MASTAACPRCATALKPLKINFTEVMLKCNTVRTSSLRQVAPLPKGKLVSKPPIRRYISPLNFLLHDGDPSSFVGQANSIGVERKS